MWTMGTPGSLIFIGLVAVMVAVSCCCCCCWRDEAATWTDLFNRTLQRLDLTRAHDHHRRRGSWPDVLSAQVNLPSRRTRRPGEISMTSALSGRWSAAAGSGTSSRARPQPGSRPPHR